MKIRKAVILAAGMGTRMLPASKVIPKEILPVIEQQRVIGFLVGKRFPAGFAGVPARLYVPLVHGQ